MLVKLEDRTEVRLRDQVAVDGEDGLGRYLGKERKCSASPKGSGLAEVVDPAAKVLPIAKVLLHHVAQIIDGQEYAPNPEADHMQYQSLQDRAARHTDHWLGNVGCQ
jgi:hypothetical protein